MECAFALADQSFVSGIHFAGEIQEKFLCWMGGWQLVTESRGCVIVRSTGLLDGFDERIEGLDADDASAAG